MGDDKKAMENMFNITEIYLDTSEKRTKIPKLAQEFFNALDNDGDGKVQIHEFLGFAREQGLTKMNNRHLFDTLDRDGNGSLDFLEVMCLFYIVKSGRPFCGGCGCFIADIFFTCNKCFHNEEGSFSLCTTCFHKNRFQHKHEQNYFLDNFAMLEWQRLQAVAATKPESSSSTSHSTSNAIVPFTPAQKKQRIMKFELFNAGLAAIGGAVGNAAGAVAGAAATAGGSCNIM